MTEVTQQWVDEVDLARSREYSLLSRLFLQSPDQPLLDQLAQLRSDGTLLGDAHQVLADVSRRMNQQAVAREYFKLFTGVGRGEILPYASFYLTGSLHGRPLADLRLSLQELGVERNDALAEPEDHAGVLCEIRAALLGGILGCAPQQKEIFFKQHMASWMGRLFEDLEHSACAHFYVGVGIVGRTLFQIEQDAVRLPSAAS